MITERRRIVFLSLALILAFLSFGVLPQAPAEAQVSALPLNFGDVAIFATNSVRIDNGAQVTSGHVVVNDASTGPTLSPGFELRLGNNVHTSTGYAVVGDSISIGNGSVVGGNAFFNTLSNSGTINGTQNTPLALPVFTPLPTFKSAPPGTLDVTVPAGTTQTLAAGSYRDIKVMQNATLMIAQGEVNARSITVSNGGKLRFLNLASGPTEVKVANEMTTGNGCFIGPDDSDPLKAARIVFYVASSTSTTVAVDTGNGCTLLTNIYAPNGTLILDNGTTAVGAFLAKNVDVQNGSTVALESFFTQQAPAITSADNVTFRPGLPGQTFTVTTTGVPTNTITRTGTLPAGVTFNDNGDNTATIAGTPAAATQSGSPYAWVITASNGVPPNAVQNFTFNVVCPTITVNGTIPDLRLNQPMATATFTQTGGSGTVTWSATGLPNGVGINASSGDVTGTPTVTGTFNATVTATDAGGCTGSKNVTFMVKDPPQITSANSTTFAPGVAAQTFTVTTTGFPTNTITRTGTLPAGVTFTDNNNNTATIAGTPAAGTQAGSPYAWVITAANGAPPDATQNFTFNVTCPVITVSGTIPALVVNVAMTPVTFTQVGGNPPITWSATGLPTGLTINPATGDVTGTPTVTGTFNVTITASDVGACMGSKMQTVTVAPQAMNDSYAGLVDNTQFVITGGTTASPGTPFVGSTIKLTDNDQPSGSVSATAGTFATSAGGSVTIASDGTFVYTPKANPGAAATTSDSFTYTAVSNEVTSAPATVTLTLAERVWYVLNTAGGNGQSQAPFNLLSDGIAASTANDTIFVYQGDGTTTNLATASTLKPGQHFLGQGVALVVNSNTLVPAGGFPLIGNAVTLANGVVVDGIDLATGTNSGVVGTSATGFTVTVRHLTTTTGTALGLDGTTGTVTMTSVTTNGGGAGATHVILTNVNGTVALNGGALAGSGGKAIDINGGTANVTYAGTIANSATGITVANKTGGAVTLSGASKTLNTAANTAVTLASNTGATIDLSGGGLDIDTTSGVGFSATGGGTVTVTGSGNTITSGTGTALNVTSTTIGAGGLTFQSIAANGASHGVVLSSTGTAGGLTVTGTGTAGSGGTIQNITDRGVSVTDAADISLRWMTFTNAATTNGADPTNPASGCGDLTTGGNLSCNAPIYLVNVSKIGTDPSVTLANLTITNSAQVGINVNNVDGLSLTDTTMSGMGNQTREYGIKARNLFGAVTFDNLSISSSFGDHVRIDNNGGQATTLNVIDSAFSTTTEGNGFTFNPNGTATTVVNIASSSFTNNFATGLIIGPTMSTAGGTVTIDVTGGPFTNNNAGIQIFGNGTADVTYDIHNIANISGNPAAGIQNDMSSLSLSTASLVGKIRSNTITMPASGAGNGIGLTARGAGTSTIQVSDNAVINTSQFGVFLHRKEGLTPGALNATVNDNTVTTSDVLADLLFPIDSIRVEAGAAAADTGTVCANITANTANGAGSQVDAPGSDIRLRHRFAHTFNVVVNAGGPTGPITGAQAAAALDVLNPASGTTDATTTTSFTGITAATGCPTP